MAQKRLSEEGINGNKEKTQDKEDMENKNGIQVPDFKTVMIL